MFNKRRLAPLRRSLCLEVLEDRTLLDGNVTVMFNPTSGLLSITGDNGNNGIRLMGGAMGEVTVAAEDISPIPPTSINSMIGNTPTFTGVTAISILFRDGNDTVDINPINISGAIAITMGTGNDNITVDSSTFQQLDVTVGREENGARGTIDAAIRSDTITGNHVNVSLLNESGVSLKRIGGSTGSSPGARIELTTTSLQFTGGGNLNVRADDGVRYKDDMTQGSTAQISFINTAGNIGVVLGDHFRSVRLSGLEARNLTQSVGRDNDAVFVQVRGDSIKSSETVTVGNNSDYAPSPFVTVESGHVGSGGPNDGVRLIVGNNTNPGISAWPVAVRNMTINGNLSIVAGNGVAATVDPTTCSGRLDVTMGSGGINQLESLTMASVISDDPVITFNSNVGDTVKITMQNVTITNPFALLFMLDAGHGKDVVTLTDVHIVGFLIVLLSDSGQNKVSAMNVTTAGGIIFGGAGNGDEYDDNGGNSGFIVLGFEKIVKP